MFSLLHFDWHVWLTVLIFLTVFTIIIFEWVDKAVTAMSGAVILLVTHTLTFEEAIHAVNFEIIVLLASMMVIVEIAQQSGLFSLLNFKLVHFSKGNPFLMFLFFMLITAFASAFLDNVTTILIVVPVTIALVQGTGRDPFPYIVGEIILSNIGGALTIVGDPPNILVGTSAGLSFNSFLVYLSLPIAVIIVATLAVFYMICWKDLKPIHHHLPRLFLSNLLLERIRYKYILTRLDKPYMITVALILGLTIFGFLMQFFLGLPLAVIAGAGALLLMLVVHKKIHVHEVLKAVEWPTLGFFAGLFVLVGSLESIGLLDAIALFIVHSTQNFPMLLMLVLWSAGLLSMIIDNIPFVTVMIPVVFNLREHFAGNPHLDLLWWALILGAALGGNGTLVGASANVIGSDLARKNGVPIQFLMYFKYAFPLTLMALSISSAYILALYHFF